MNLKDVNSKSGKPQYEKPKDPKARLKFVATKVGHKWGAGVAGRNPTIVGLTEREANDIVERCNK